MMSPKGLHSRKISLGYNTFYKNENYHIIHHKGPGNLHEMSVESNS